MNTKSVLVSIFPRKLYCCVGSEICLHQVEFNQNAQALENSWCRKHVGPRCDRDINKSFILNVILLKRFRVDGGGA